MLDSAKSRVNAVGHAAHSAQREPPRLAPTGRSSLLLVANANASGLDGKRETVDRAASLLRGFGAQVETRWTASPRELDEFVSEEERRVVLVGGDGTLHAVANVDGHKPEVALLPRGRANNIAHALGVPLDLSSAARLAVEGIPQPVDGISVESPELTMTAVEGISLGFHAQARARYRGLNSADTAAGVAAALSAFAHFEPVSVALELDGEVELRRLGQLFVVNFPLFGPRLPVAPGADPGDGVLEVVELDAGRRSSLVLELARVRRGTHLGRRGVRVRGARRIRIATRGRSPVVADTTVLSSGPVELAVRPHTLHVVAPAR
ncbi:MAG: diacylglycerol/lipid kinase family protein [Gaiellaceae bacterium]